MIKILGDVMLDRWIKGTATRMSPEAPIPIILKQDENLNAGGAANVAVNLARLKIKVDIWGAMSNDLEGFTLLNLLAYEGMSINIKRDADYTTEKTRIIGQGGHHVVRLDREKFYTGNVDDDFVETLERDDIVVISDYAKGVIKIDTVSKILSKTHNIFVDPKQSPLFYTGAFLVKPNMKEYMIWNGDFEVASAIKFMRKYDWTWLIITEGSKGVHILHTDGHYHHHKEPSKEVADVSGAGDAFLAVLIYGINKGYSVKQSCELACYAAARNVEKQGVVPVSPQDIDRGVVWTNGVFDIIHTGHLELLKFAKSQGKKLIVGINDDDSVKRLKGADRPINKCEVRKKQLEILSWVDSVVVFSEDTPKNILEKIRPDVIVKGGDYTVETTVGNDLAKVIIFPKLEGYSTSNIINKLVK